MRRRWVTHHFQLLIARAEPLPLAGDDGEQRVHLTLRKLSVSSGARTCGEHKHAAVVTLYHPLNATELSSSGVNMHIFNGFLMTAG